MTFSQNFVLALPEAILAGSALILLLWGAFQGKASVAFTTACAAALVAAAVTAAAAWVPASAHHSFAMFDNNKNMTIEGVVKEFQWTNPHTWVQVMVKDASGKEVEWSVEGGSPNGLARQGWTRRSAKPGDKAVVVIHPLKDGGAGGSLVSLSVNGEKVGKRRIGS